MPGLSSHQCCQPHLAHPRRVAGYYPNSPSQGPPRPHLSRLMHWAGLSSRVASIWTSGPLNVATTNQRQVTHAAKLIRELSSFLDANLSATMDKSACQPLQLEGGTITVKAATFNASKEWKVTALEWVKASNHYINLLHTHLWARGDSAPGGPATCDIADKWDTHFRHI